MIRRFEIDFEFGLHGHYLLTIMFWFQYEDGDTGVGGSWFGL
jgi:hypothetical protein